MIHFYQDIVAPHPFSGRIAARAVRYQERLPLAFLRAQVDDLAQTTAVRHGHVTVYPWKRRRQMTIALLTRDDFLHHTGSILGRPAERDDEDDGNMIHWFCHRGSPLRPLHQYVCAGVSRVAGQDSMYPRNA